MSWEDKEDNTIYKVVLNHEEQYSIWPVDRDNPLGWKDAGKSGSKKECLEHIKDVWTDMRPLSLRKQMEEAVPRAEAKIETNTSKPNAMKSISGINDLVQYLSTGDHPIEASLRPEKTVKAFKESIDRGYVHIKFMDTKGGTELDVRLDNNASDLSKANFNQKNGNVHLVGSLTLNYVSVQCIADIDLNTLEGKGHLVPVQN